ncbi:MAG: hypothetical protein B7Y55_02145 [Polynucleobacter sp. 35-46-207]|jgi:hypothetical protein|nr:MAG: hypothetical protein B7Y55_02145 [Polynucleobacter sp. 35-46-207]
MANEYIGGGAAAGAQSAAQGIGSGFKALAMAPMVAQQAEQNTALTLAKIFANQQSGSKYEQEARGLRMTNDNRGGVDQMISADPSMDKFRQAQLVAFKMAGPQYMDNFSRSGQIEQKIADIAAIKTNPALATPAAQAYFATSGSAPFDDVGNTGSSINRVTGGQAVTNPTLEKIYENKGGSKTAKGDPADKGRRTDIAENNQIRLQYNTEYPLSFGQRPKDAPNFQTYLEAAKAKRNPNKNPATATTGQTINPSKPFSPTPEMINVQADYQAGKITKDQAKKKLKDLGMPD